MFQVCIADDEEYVVKSITRRIEDSGMEITVAGTACNGMEAYELYEKKKPDLFFVDIHMPLCNGLDFVERVRKLDPDSTTQFIIVSGYDDFDYLKRAIRTSVVNYIMKPIKSQEFMDTLQEACENLDRIRLKQRELLDKWDYYEEYCEKNPLYSGTILLFHGEDLPNRIRDIHGITSQSMKNLFPQPKWQYVRFHHSGHLLLLVGTHIFLKEAQMQSAWISLGNTVEIGQLHVVGRVGDHQKLDAAIEEFTAHLNKRFWKPCFAILPCKIGQLKTNTLKEISLEALNQAIENVREETWAVELNSVVNEVFADPDNDKRLKIMYQSVLILAANQYMQHNFEIPENLKAEMYPFALENCLTRDAVHSKLKEYIHMIHDKIVQENSKNSLVDQVISYMEQHYTEEISLTVLANEFFVVPNYLARKFKEKKEITAMQYLEDYRIKKAEALLLTTELTVTEVAGMVGYADANYFTRTFKKKNGRSPREYRSGR